MTARPINITEEDLLDWPWLQDRIKEQDGRYYDKRNTRPHGDPEFRLHAQARHLGTPVRCVDGSFQIDVPEFRRRVERHHRLRRTKGLCWCPECGCDLTRVGPLPLLLTGS